MAPQSLHLRYLVVVKTWRSYGGDQSSYTSDRHEKVATVHLDSGGSQAVLSTHNHMESCKL